MKNKVYSYLVELNWDSNEQWQWMKKELDMTDSQFVVFMLRFLNKNYWW